MNELALFSGAGGGILGGHLLGWRTVCAVEQNSFCRRVLMQRQNDRLLPSFPIWDDVCTFNGNPWRGIVDVVSGGFPCQDISVAGSGAGIDGDQSGLWVEMARIICEVQPYFAYVENSPMLTSRGLGRVLGDLASMGYDACWGVLGADNAGAPHERKRIWILAYSTRCGRQQDGSWQFRSSSENVADATSERFGETRKFRPEQSEERFAGGGKEMANANGTGFKEQRFSESNEEKLSFSKCGSKEVADSSSIGHGIKKTEIFTRRDGIERCGWWAVEPELGRVAHGVANRVDRIRAIGNGQVPRVAQLSWEILNAI